MSLWKEFVEYGGIPWFVLHRWEGSIYDPQFEDLREYSVFGYKVLIYRRFPSKHKGILYLARPRKPRM